MLSLPKQSNPIKNNNQLTGKRTAGFSQNLNLDEMKTFCKKNSCSINDYTAALIGVSLFEYFQGSNKQVEENNDE